MKIRFSALCSDYFRRFPFVVVDVGARGGIKKEWTPLKQYLKYIAFEPDPEECERLAKQPHDFEAAFYPTALWSSKTQLPLYLTKSEGCSSVYMPDASYLEHFASENTAGYAVAKKIFISADRLDRVVSAEEKNGIDFLKVDTEGCAADVLKGASAVFADGVVLGVQVEAEFNPKYQGQTLFSEVDRTLRSHHYELFQIEGCCWKRRAGLKTGGLQGQLMHGDVSYFLTPEVFFEKISQRKSEEQVAKTIKYIVFACLYGVYDLACEMLCAASDRKVLCAPLVGDLERSLVRTRDFWLRIPKLRNDGVLKELIHHAFMLGVGVWLKKLGYWKTDVSLL